MATVIATFNEAPPKGLHYEDLSDSHWQAKNRRNHSYTQHFRPTIFPFRSFILRDPCMWTFPATNQSYQQPKWIRDFSELYASRCSIRHLKKTESSLIVKNVISPWLAL
jgi:hypothetical protein